MRVGAVILAMAMFVSLAGCQRAHESGAAQDWKAFAPEGEGFSVLLPGTPIGETESQASALGVVESAWFDLEREGDKLAYRVRYDDYPPAIFGLFDGSQLLYARQKRIEHVVEGKIVDEEAISIDEYEGKQFTIELPDEKLGLYRIFLIDQRIYQLTVKAAPQDISAGEVSQFLDSFKLL